MIAIDFTTLNPLERQIHASLSRHCASRGAIRITQAAEICGCSVSKISKFSRKLGFSNYKQYLAFLLGTDVSNAAAPDELARLQRFLDTFDSDMVEELAALIAASDKLVLIGYGPSFLCAQYFEYRLRTCAGMNALAVQDELSASTMIDANTLLLMLTVTGSFRSFDKVYRDAKARGGDAALILEEYHPSLIAKYDRVFCLAPDAQPNDLRPHEKSRTAFFIFLEEVMQRLREGREDPPAQA